MRGAIAQRGGRGRGRGRGESGGNTTIVTGQQGMVINNLNAAFRITASANFTSLLAIANLKLEIVITGEGLGHRFKDGNDAIIPLPTAQAAISSAQDQLLDMNQYSDTVHKVQRIRAANPGAAGFPTDQQMAAVNKRSLVVALLTADALRLFRGEPAPAAAGGAAAP